jgi:hypothetical protein
LKPLKPLENRGMENYNVRKELEKYETQQNAGNSTIDH